MKAAILKNYTFQLDNFIRGRNRKIQIVKELEEYNKLADKRELGKMTNEDHKRWKQLVNKSFIQEVPKITQVWMEGHKYDKI